MNRAVKVTLAQRLFAVILLAQVAVAVIAVGVLRWRLFSTPAHGHVIEPVEGLLLALGESYGRAGDWSFLPGGPDARKTWLQRECERVVAGNGIAAPGPLLPRRIGLLDRDGSLIAGVVAHRALVAFASIDTQRHAVVRDGRTIGYLVVAQPAADEEALTIAFLLDQQANLAAITVAALVLGVLVAAVAALYVRRPVRDLLTATRALAGGASETRVARRRNDELGELAEAFDRVAADLAAAEQARRQWIADTSHELRTPLAVLQGQIEAMRDGVRAPDAANLALMERHARSLSHLVDTLYQLARADVGRLDFQFEPCDAWETACDSLRAYADRLSAAGLRVAVAQAPAHAIVRADAEHLRRVFANLFENCARYTDHGGRVELAGEIRDGHLYLGVADSAPGVPPALLARLGERFLRADASRSRGSGGAGLGLALSRAIVQAHAGRLEFSDSPFGGLHATIVLPLATP